MTKIFTIKKRKEFLRVADKGFKVVTTTLILQAAPFFCDKKKKNPEAKNQEELLKNTFQIGFTATKRIGKAHDRNRTKRRLRALTRELYKKFLPNTSYVLIGRHNTATCEFSTLKSDLAYALKKINKNFVAEKPLPQPVPAEEDKE